MARRRADVPARSDIVSTSLAPGWEEVGRLAAIAAIRTFLSYFLDREVEQTRVSQREAGVAVKGE